MKQKYTLDGMCQSTIGHHKHMHSHFGVANLYKSIVFESWMSANSQDDFFFLADAFSS